MDRTDSRDMEAFARQILSAQPFSRLVGAELTDSGSQSAELTVPIVDDLTQQHGFVHGGVISYLADNAITFAGGLALGGDALTAEFKINYVRPAVGTKLIGRASASSVGRRQAVCRCDVYVATADDEKLCAMAQGTVVPAGGEAETS